MSIAIEILLNIITLGSLYALATVGFSLIYSVTKILHVAQGGLVLTAAYLFLWLVNSGMALTLAIILTIFLSAILGWLMNFLIYERLRKKGMVSTAGSLIASLGILFILQNTLLMIFGARIQSIVAPAFLSTNISIGGALLPVFDVLIVVVTGITLAMLIAFMKKSKLGTALRACSDDETVSEIIGINTHFIRNLSFIIGSALSCVTGILFALKFSLEPNMSLLISIRTFTRAIVGGVGSIWGALLGGLLIELAENIGGWFINAAYKNIISFVIVFLFLIMRPQGIFGQKKD